MLTPSGKAYRAHLGSIVSSLADKRILVIGDVMLDEYLQGDAQRISPEAPVPIVELKSSTCTPGGAANVAANVARLGGAPCLFSVIGRDLQAEQLREALMARGVSSDGLLVDHSRPTTTKSRLVVRGHQVARFDRECRVALSRPIEDTLLRCIGSELRACDAVVISDYGKGVVSRSLVTYITESARAAHKPVVIDPKSLDFSKYRGATVVTPNLHEARAAAATDGDILLVGAVLVGVLDGGGLLITCGPEGMSLFQRQSDPVHIASVARAVFDVTGAGDTVVSTLALALAAGCELAVAAHIASVAAGIVVGKVGTATATLEELGNWVAAVPDGAVVEPVSRMPLGTAENLERFHFGVLD
jgi:D-beta-D-heptose 7-phosphate kinase/D-beta-D-heptose 1-phosphate adenosyltransferase